ncbi:hypothetical protein [Chitinophaga japonensis]|uniref:Uncharacterized protein n=1 Tax=Chitinophaga japonensis TaxID=104662 RepID=A0A562T7H2_CHIJA|nr:hypothetical protein [Chitinophaga japonensis]TWI89263.1 hypothetical protein LX66_3358 [Chitinophaga japonensis]
MSEVLMQTIVDKLNEIDATVGQLKEKMPTVPDYSRQLTAINQSITQAQESVVSLPLQLKFPTAAVHTLTQHLEVNNDLLRRPPKQEIRHHHHLAKGIIASGVLGLLLIICACWIYRLYERQDNYKANDIKYRYLKIEGTSSLQALLYKMDSLYHKDMKAMRDSVVQWEADRERRMELQEKAAQKEREAELLREQAQRK